MPTTFAFNAPERAARRLQMLAEVQGYYTETFSRSVFGGAAALTSGTVYFTAVPLLAGDVVSSLVVDCNTAGATMTLTKLGLYDKNANRLAVSADASGAFGTTGVKTVSMVVTANGQPYTVPVDDLYYTAWLGVATTIPGIARTTGVVATAGPTAYGYTGLQSGQTDLNATHTITFNTGSATPTWVGVA